MDLRLKFKKLKTTPSLCINRRLNMSKLVLYFFSTEVEVVFYLTYMPVLLYCRAVSYKKICI